MNNFPLTCGSYSFTDGLSGQAALLNTRAYMVDYAFSDLLLSKQFTIEYTLRADARSGFLFGWNGGGMLYSALRTGSNYMFIEYNSGNTHGAQYGFDANTQKTDGWVHYAVVRNGDNFKMFVDGKIAVNANNDNCNALGSDRRHNTIGGHALGGIYDWFMVSDIAKYNHEFTPTWI